MSAVSLDLRIDSTPHSPSNYMLTLWSGFVHRVRPPKARRVSPLEPAARKAHKHGNWRSGAFVHISGNAGDYRAETSER
jgi:hypothetical protein